MADELDPKDKALLENIDAFNRTYAATGWHIQEKEVKEDLSRVALFRSSLTSVQFLHVNLKSAMLTDTQFVKVDFQQAKFTGAVLRNVVFTECKFTVCSFEKARLTDCRFVHCVTEELNARDAIFEGCGFDSLEDHSGVFGSAAFRNCSFAQCRLDNSSFHGTEFNAVPMKQSELKNVVFTAIQGTGLAFEDSTLYNCGFEDSQYGSLVFERGTSKGLTLNGFQSENLRIQNCGMIQALTIRDSKWFAPTITGCQAISELTIGQSQMKDLTIERSQIAYFEMKETEVSGNSRIEGCRIAGLNLEKSTLLGMQMANCAVASYLIADEATLDAVVLRGVEYAPGLRISTKGVKYLNRSGELGG